MHQEVRVGQHVLASGHHGADQLVGLEFAFLICIGQRCRLPRRRLEIQSTPDADAFCPFTYFSVFHKVVYGDVGCAGWSEIQPVLKTCSLGQLHFLNSI